LRALRLFVLGCAFACALACALAACRNRSATGYEEPPPDGTVITSPVDRSSCQKRIETPSMIYESRTYYFCSREEADRFAKSPERWADPR
jgi:YHS domain-containing protein